MQTDHMTSQMYALSSQQDHHTYSINEDRGIHQQSRHETMFVTCHAVESSSKDQVTHL